MRRLALGLAGFVIGGLGGYAACILLYMLVYGLLGLPDRDGGTGIAVAMFIGPLVAVIAGILTATWLVVRAERDASLSRVTRNAVLVIIACVAGLFAMTMVGIV